MPTPAKITKNSLSSIGPSHVIKFSGENAPYSARAFYEIPLMLAQGEYLVLTQDKELHLYGLKNGISKYQLENTTSSVDLKEKEHKISGQHQATLIIHRDPIKEPSDSFPLIKKLLAVAKQVQAYCELKNRVYKAGEEEKKLADLDLQKDLLRQIQDAHSGKPVAIPSSKVLSKAKAPKSGEAVKKAIKKIQQKSTGYPKLSPE